MPELETMSEIFDHAVSHAWDDERRYPSRNNVEDTTDNVTSDDFNCDEDELGVG